MNAIAERFVGSIRREALDNYLIFTEKQISKIIKEYIFYYNNYRFHQGINKVPVDYCPQKNGRIISMPVLSGLHHHYYRKKSAQFLPSYNYQRSVLLCCIRRGFFKRYLKSFLIISFRKFTLNILLHNSFCANLLVHFSNTSLDFSKEVLEFYFSLACHKSNTGSYSVKVIGKGHKEREIYILEDLYELIVKHCSGDTGHIFKSIKGNILTRTAIYKTIKKLGKKILNKNISPHVLRHSHIGTMIQKYPEKIQAISQYVGHSSTSTTLNMYVHEEILPSDIERIAVV